MTVRFKTTLVNAMMNKLDIVIENEIISYCNFEELILSLTSSEGSLF